MSKESLAKSGLGQRLQLINRFYLLNHFKIDFRLLSEQILVMILSEARMKEKKKPIAYKYEVIL